MEPYEEFIEGNANLLFQELSSVRLEKGLFGKDLYDPLSYFFLDQFCNGMYIARCFRNGTNPSIRLRFDLGRTITGHEEHIIEATGDNFVKLGYLVYRDFTSYTNELTTMTGAALFMAAKLGRTDYYPKAIELIMQTKTTN